MTAASSENNWAIWSLLNPADSALLAPWRGKNRGSSPSPPSSDWLKPWLKSTALGDATLLIIYGIDGGTPYHYLKGWLLERSERKLLILESEPEELINFLDSAQASELLEDSKVWIRFIPSGQAAERALEESARVTPFYEVRIAAVPSHRGSRYNALKRRIELRWEVERATAQELKHNASGYFKHFYRHLGDLPEVGEGLALRGSFSGIPAIICGAGPSLTKQCPQLKELKDCALIISGGTGIIALNSLGIHPHLGFGVDPNPSTMERTIAMSSWQVPFLYTYRMNHSAFEHVLGDKLLINTSHEIKVAEWFHSELKTMAFGTIQMPFYNVIHLCTLMAIEMGCHPIIFIGMDLAYTGAKPYASGVESDFIAGKEKRIIYPDIYGEPVETLAKWVAESCWYEGLTAMFKPTLLLNATEGGIGLGGIQNIAFDDAIKNYLTHSWDIEGRVHAAVQRCPPCLQDKEALAGALEKFLKSVVRCRAELKQQEHNQDDLPLTPAIPSEEKLALEPAYKALLKPLDFYNEAKIAYILKRSCFHDTTTELKVLQKNRYNHLLSALKGQEELLLAAISCKAPDHQSLWPKISKPFKNSPLISSSYDDGGHLDGLSLGYGLDGKIVCNSLYRRGKREGESLYYWADGALYSRSFYSRGLLEGTSHFFYRTGEKRGELSYRTGELEGQALWYYSNGALHLHGTYIKGRRDGLFRLWYADGVSYYQGSYRQGVRIGEALRWHANGQIAERKSYDNKGVLIAEERWDAGGQIIQGADVALLAQIKEIKDSLELILSHFEQLGPLLSGELYRLYCEDCAILKSDIAEAGALISSMLGAGTCPIDEEIHRLKMAMENQIKTFITWQRRLQRSAAPGN